MKQILSIIVIILLFIFSALIFWAGLAPQNFSNFFSNYPEIGDTANQLGILNNQTGDLSENIFSELVSGTNGKIIIGKNSWDVEIADNDQTRTNGLSNRKVLYNQGGMLFVFDKMAYQSFWMKDMLIPIDIVFFDNNWRIVLIESNLQANTFPKIFGNDIKSQYVLEINALEAQNYDLEVGDQAVFLNK